MVRRKVEVRREEILTATLDEVVGRGLANVRVADVADVLAISRALVFYHFETKERLLAAALEYAVARDLERLEMTLARDPDAVQRLRHVLRAYGPQGKAPGWTLWVDAWASALRDPKLRRELRGLDRRWSAALEGVIRSGVQEGVFECPDPGAGARRLAALLDGLAVQVTVHRRLSRAEMSRWVREAAAAELGIEPELLS
ncbi:MAG TPA: TetR family transcriptional regulator C-terminal domain-containing protein [Nocardioidaceae bacterium]|nr:TetR family transcriptional regulator C-terminal domain-containing protein [Nocardioidaceae bacterium]